VLFLMNRIQFVGNSVGANISRLPGFGEVAIESWNGGRVAVVVDEEIWAVDAGSRDTFDLLHGISHVHGEIVIARHVNHDGPFFVSHGEVLLVRNEKKAQKNQRKSLIRTMSLIADQRYTAILPSREKAKLVRNSDLKLVNCFGGPPSSGLLQTLS